MKKQTLNEEISRIKGMMGKIMNESFDDFDTQIQPEELPYNDDIDMGDMNDGPKYEIMDFYLNDDGALQIDFYDDNNPDSEVESEKFRFDYDVEYHGADRGDYGPEGYGPGHDAYNEVYFKNVVKVEPEEVMIGDNNAFYDYITNKYGKGVANDIWDYVGQ